jgi:hypothetical protein
MPGPRRWRALVPPAPGRARSWRLPQTRGEPFDRGDLGGGPRTGGGQEPVGPFLGEQAGLAEDDRDVGPADLQFGEPVRDKGGPDPLQLEHLGIAVLDHHRGAGQRGKLGQRVAQLPAGQAGHQVSHGLALDRGDQPSADHQAIVTAGQRPPDRANLPPAEPVGIPLMGVDRDLQLGDPGRPGGGGGHVRAGLLAGARGLPEDSVAAAGPGEHDLGAVLPPPVQDQVDGRAPPHTRPDAHAFDNVGVAGPLIRRNRIAVHGAGPRPGPRGAEHHPASQRQQQQIRQPGIRVRIAGDQQLHADQPPTRPGQPPWRPRTEDRRDYRHHRGPVMASVKAPPPGPAAAASDRAPAGKKTLPD